MGDGIGGVYGAGCNIGHVHGNQGLIGWQLILVKVIRRKISASGVGEDNVGLVVFVRLSGGGGGVGAGGRYAENTNHDRRIIVRADGHAQG